MNVNAAFVLLVQIVDPMRAAFAQQITERTNVRRAPARPMGNDNVCDIQQFAPAMPARQAQKGVHTQYETQ